MLLGTIGASCIAPNAGSCYADYNAAFILTDPFASAAILVRFANPNLTITNSNFGKSNDRCERTQGCADCR